MNRPLRFTPGARRDFEAILAWHTENMSVRAATKVGATIRKRLKVLGSGRVRGAEASTERQSPYLRAVARKHVIIFLVREDHLLIARIVHAAQDIEAILTALDERSGD